MSHTALLAVIFWAGVSATLYAYVGFPLLVALLVKRGRREIKPGVEEGPNVPVTVIIPAYNEERNIEAKIRNVLDSDYPPSLLDVIVVSDASTDHTDETARRFEQHGVRLIVQEKRKGKSAGLNRAISIARGQLVVFTDANASYSKATLATLVRYFQHPGIGLVSGYTKYTTTEAGHIAEATNAYTSLERVIKRAESRWGCCVGADGAIFAMRRSLYRTLEDDDINDFILPLGVIEQGYECVFADDAFCSENPGKNLESEFRRQSRITNRTLRALWRHAHLLNPFRFPTFSFFLVSHKVARFLVPIALLASAISLASLAPTGGMYQVAAITALFVVVLAALSNTKAAVPLPRLSRGRLLHLVNVFLTTNLAVLDGWRRFLTGRADVTWQHDRSSGTPVSH